MGYVPFLKHASYDPGALNYRRQSVGSKLTTVSGYLGNNIFLGPNQGTQHRSDELLGRIQAECSYPWAVRPRPLPTPTARNCNCVSRGSDEKRPKTQPLPRHVERTHNRRGMDHSRREGQIEAGRLELH